MVPWMILVLVDISIALIHDFIEISLPVSRNKRNQIKIFHLILSSFRIENMLQLVC